MTCWCFSCNRCFCWDVPAWGNTGSVGALGDSSKLGWSLRYQLGRRLMKSVVPEWLLALCLMHWACTVIWFSAPVFSKIPMTSVKQLFFLPLSQVYTRVFRRVPRSNTKSEVTHCLVNTGVPWFLVSGGCRNEREAVSHLEFPVWVLGRLLGIPIIIRNFLFQLRSLPDKLELHTRCVINSSMQFCSFEAHCNNRLWACSAETTFWFSSEKICLSQAFCYYCCYS